MEMSDVLTKLKEIAESKPELVKDAVDNVEKTNPKVDESAMKNFLHDEAEKLSRKDFIAKHGESLSGFYDAINGTEDDEEKDSIAAGEAKMMKKEDKKETVKEDMHITTDSPEEAGMLMQILKMA